MNSLLLVSFCICFVNVLIVTLGNNCPDPDGGHVSWWILYQQKSLPFLHFYADSRNNQNLKLHFPERRESVLAKAINKILVGELDHYIVYSNDLLNVAKVAEAMRLPSFLKWNHGIIAMDSSLSRGFWILHNNLFFPPFQEKDFVEPGGKVWKESTIGDTTDNVFYICLSAGSEEKIRQVLTSMLAGNAFFLHSNPPTLFQTETYTKSRDEHITLYHGNGEPLPFMNCLFNPDSNKKTSCLFQFSSGVNPSKRVYVYTRPRSPIAGANSYCYSSGVNSGEESLTLLKSNRERVNDYSSMDTIFALSNDPSSDAYGTTCFGQDVAAYTDIVTVMVCLKLPSLHRDLLRASIVTKSICSNHG